MDYLRLLRSDGPDIARADPGTPITFTAATPGKKRDGLDTADLPWRTDRYASNPVVTWVHDLGGNRLPIGRADVEVIARSDGEAINASVIFDVADPFASEVDRKFRTGFLHAVSVSWDDVDEDGIPVRRSGKNAVAHDLLEVAAVPVPGDWDALVERQVTALRALQAAMVGLADDGDGVPDEHAAGATPGGDAVDSATDGATPDVGNVDGEMRTAAASAMLAAFDRSAADDERRTRYNWACVMYRWLKLTPPDWIDGNELRALDDENWRAVVAGELEVIGDGARLGAELSSRNIQDLSEALASIESGAKSIRALIERVAEKRPPVQAKTDSDDESEDGERGVAEDTIDALSTWLDAQLAQRAGG